MMGLGVIWVTRGHGLGQDDGRINREEGSQDVFQEWNPSNFLVV